MSDQADNSWAVQMAALKAQYASNLPTKFTEIESYWNKLQQQWDLNVLEQLNLLIHRLAGSAGSYGFPDGSRVAKEIEIFLMAFLKRSSKPGSDFFARGTEMIQELKKSFTS